ncbi:MAG: hypothetical protein OEZ43_12760 [Gammaproteobacteria bacterium]|nr:hypothetical protein [Gammaproteobacteria bacterium]
MKRIALYAVPVFLFIACAEPLPTITDRTTGVVNQRPVIILPGELGGGESQSIITLDDQTRVSLTDSRGEFDQSAIRANRQIRSRTTAAVSASGTSRIKERIFYQAGLVTSYKLYDYDASGIRTRRTTFDAPGADGVWFTPDDDVLNYTSFVVANNPLGAQAVVYSTPGADTIWFTADDTVTLYVADVVDATGAAVATAHYNAPGLDGVWFTADDDVMSVSADTVLADGSEQWVLYRGPGPDMDWATLGDNVIGHFSLVSHNAAGQADKHVFFINPGLDLLPNTPDDVVGYYHNYVYNDVGNLTNSLFFSNPGLDMIWFNADDVAESCGITQFNADNTPSISTNASVGADNTCFTADDVITGYHTHTYDATAHMTETNVYNDAGADLQWYTEDDVLSRRNTYIPN